MIDRMQLGRRLLFSRDLIEITKIDQMKEAAQELELVLQGTRAFLKDWRSRTPIVTRARWSRHAFEKDR